MYDVCVTAMPESTTRITIIEVPNRTAKLMKCPMCSLALTAKDYVGQTVDVCDGCRGLWCDTGELGAVVNALISANKVPNGESGFFAAARQHEDHDVQAKPCPRCNKMTDSFNFAYDSNIFLNRCNACDGIWLDGGELRSVAQFIKKTLQS